MSNVVLVNYYCPKVSRRFLRISRTSNLRALLKRLTEFDPEPAAFVEWKSADIGRGRASNVKRLVLRHLADKFGPPILGADFNLEHKDFLIQELQKAEAAWSV